MTVRELIEKLAGMPQDAIVVHMGYYDLMFPIEDATYDSEGKHWGDSDKRPTSCPVGTVKLG